MKPRTNDTTKRKLPRKDDESSFDESNDGCEVDITPEAHAQKIIDPIIESMRKKMEKIDVTQFKK